MNIEIRAAMVEDIPSIHNIYHESVVTDTASWELTPPDLAEMESRVRYTLSQNFPFLVAVAVPSTEEEQFVPRVVGYSYGSSFRARPGYRFTVEDSIYVEGNYRRHGIARKLLSALIEGCTALGYRQMVAVIGGSERLASITLHQKLGFEHVGLLPSIGLKHSRWLDCVLMQRTLGVGDATIPNE